MVTEKQFNDFAEKVFAKFDQVFLRFDQMDDAFALLVRRMDHIEDKLNRNIRELQEFKAEVRETNTKMDARITKVETWTKS